MNNHSLKVLAEGLIEGAVEKHETKLVKEKQSSFVTLQDFQSARHEWEQKIKGIICQALADEIKYKNLIAELDDPSYSEPTKDPTQLAHSIFAAAEVELGEAVEKHEETMKEAVEKHEETRKEALQKHEETMLIKEKQSSFVTLQNLQSGLDELEWKMQVLISDVLWENESDIISEGISDMFDPSSSETTNDLTQLPNSVYAGNLNNPLSNSL